MIKLKTTIDTPKQNERSREREPIERENSSESFRSLFNRNRLGAQEEVPEEKTGKEVMAQNEAFTINTQIQADVITEGARNSKKPQKEQQQTEAIKDAIHPKESEQLSRKPKESGQAERQLKWGEQGAAEGDKNKGTRSIQNQKPPKECENRAQQKIKASQSDKATSDKVTQPDFQLIAAERDIKPETEKEERRNDNKKRDVFNQKKEIADINPAQAESNSQKSDLQIMTEGKTVTQSEMTKTIYPKKISSDLKGMTEAIRSEIMDFQSGNISTGTITIKIKPSTLGEIVIIIEQNTSPALSKILDKITGLPIDIRMVASNPDVTNYLKLIKREVINRCGVRSLNVQTQINSNGGEKEEHLQNIALSKSRQMDRQEG